MLIHISQPVSEPWTNFPISGTSCGWLKGFSWLSPRSDTSLIKAVVKKVVLRTSLFFLLGTAFMKRFYCQPQPVWFCRWAAVNSVLNLIPSSIHRALDPHVLAGLPGLPWDCPCHCELAGRSLHCVWLMAASGPDPDANLSLGILADHQRTPLPHLLKKTGKRKRMVTLRTSDQH